MTSTDACRNNPLRVAVFSDSALPVSNGVSVSVDRLVQTLRARGSQAVLFGGPGISGPGEARFSSPIRLFGHPAAWPCSIRCHSEFHRQDWDVVHLHTPGPIGWAGLRWARRRGIPVVMTAHTRYSIYPEYLPFFPKPIARLILQRLCRHWFRFADQIIAPGRSAVKWVEGLGAKKPLIVPTGVPLQIPSHRAAARMRLGIPPHEKSILYVGRLGREKNLEILVQAGSLILDRDPEARMRLIGEGPERSQLEDMIRQLGRTRSILMPGAVPPHEVHDWLASADLFLTASSTETQGLAVLEAMAHGLPVAALRGDGVSELIEEEVSGVLTNPCPYALSRAGLKILQDPLRAARLGGNARRRAQEFSVERMTDQVLAVYAEAMGQSAPRVMSS